MVFIEDDAAVLGLKPCSWDAGGTPMTEFEMGFERASLDNRRLFEDYAARLRMRASESCVGYTSRVEKKERSSTWRWLIQLEKGWHSGCEIEIEPKRDRPHRAIVSISGHSKLRRVLMRVAALLYLGGAILMVLPGLFVMRLGFLLILIFLLFFPYMLLAFGLIRLLEALTGTNEMSPERRRELVEHLQTVPIT